MPLYTLKADIEFRADDLPDALDKLAHHFLSVALELESDLITKGEIEVVAVEEEE